MLLEIRANNLKVISKTFVDVARDIESRFSEGLQPTTGLDQKYSMQVVDQRGDLSIVSNMAENTRQRCRQSSNAFVDD